MDEEALRDQIVQHIATAEIDSGVLLQDDYERFPIFRIAFTLAADRIISMLNERGLLRGG